jgi:hypothetical protein
MTITQHEYDVLQRFGIGEARKLASQAFPGNKLLFITPMSIKQI